MRDRRRAYRLRPGEVGREGSKVTPTKNIGFLGGGFKYFLFSPRKLGKIPILTSIFFRWVETTNQLQLPMIRKLGKYIGEVKNIC